MAATAGNRPRLQDPTVRATSALFILTLLLSIGIGLLITASTRGTLQIAIPDWAEYIKDRAAEEGEQVPLLGENDTRTVVGSKRVLRPRQWNRRRTPLKDAYKYFL